MLRVGVMGSCLGLRSGSSPQVGHGSAGLAITRPQILQLMFPSSAVLLGSRKVQNDCVAH